MKKSFSKVPAITRATLSLLSMMAMSFSAHAGNYPVQAEFTGIPSLNTPPPDQFGSTVSIQGENLVNVGAAGSAPDGLPEAGAVYFFGKNGNTWSASQTPYTNPNAGNLVADVIIAARDQWLFVPANGTPLNQPDPDQKDYSGAILVFQLNRNNQYELVQTIFNPDGTVDDSFFGFNLSYNGGDWMVAGGVNVSKAYFFKLNSQTNQWEFTQSVSVIGTTNTTGYVFPSIFGTHALISQVIPSIPNTQSNGAVFAYEFNGTQWNYIQTLAGIDTEYSITYSCYDSYGEFIAVNGNNAIVSAPQDTDTAHSSQQIAGAVYFYSFQNDQWQLNAKVRSSEPSTLFGWGLAIDGNIAVIGDSGRTVNKKIFQGALQVYEKQGNRWIPSALLVDPNGRTYDFFGGGGLDINGSCKLIFGGSDTASSNYIPENFPGQGNNPNNNGRAVLYAYN